MSILQCKVGGTESRDQSACPYWLYCVQPRLFDWPPSNLRHGTSHHQGLKPDQIGSEWPNSILVRPMKLILYQETLAIIEIDFVPGPFPCQIELSYLDFAVDMMNEC